MPYPAEYMAEVKGLVKSKLKELGAFVDEELPDYIMVMVANKKKRESMNNDLQLFLGAQTEHFTEWLHSVLESYLKPEDKKKRTPSIPNSKEEKRVAKRQAKTNRVEAKYSKSRSRSRSPVSQKTSQRTSVESEVDVISVRTDENEFIEETSSSVQKEAVPQTTTKPKEQRRIVSTSSLTGPSTDASGEAGPGLRSVVKLSTHVPCSSTMAPHARPGGLLLKRAMTEAQASVASTTPTSPTKSTLPAAVVHGRKRPADQMGPTSEDDIAPPAAKSTRFVVTLNESAVSAKGVSGAGGVSNVKSRLGPRITTSRLSVEADRDDALGSTLEMLDARDILIAKKLQKSKTTMSAELLSTNTNHMIAAEKPKDIAPMVISLNDTDEDELAETARLLKSPTKTGTVAKEQSAEPPKRENIPSTLERCKYWPSCRNGASCPYMHPKEECQNFPNCRYGDRCLYFHPACKFGASCSRLGCPFSHAGQPPSIATQTLGVLCRFYPRCKNAVCPFLHPPKPLAKTAVAKVCRYGNACTNRTTCPFSHPSGAAAVGANASLPATNKLKWVAPGKASSAAADSTIPKNTDGCAPSSNNQLTGITPTNAALASSGVTV